ncbi:MAG: hypothetical protein ACOYOO_15930, partial [Saprospiraceae bacterium]
SEEYSAAAGGKNLFTQPHKANINMKPFAFIALAMVFAIPSPLLSQAQAFRNFIIAANSPTNPKSAKDAFQVLGGEERFELAVWGKGWVVTAENQLVQEGYLFNFDYEKNDLYVRDEAEGVDIVVDKSSLRTFFLLKGPDTVVFVRSKAIDPEGKTFFQLVGGDPKGSVVLLKHRVSRALPVNKNDYMRNFSGDYAPHYQSKVTYYVMDAKLGTHAFNHFGKKELLGLYPAKAELLNAFFERYKRPDDRAFHLLFDSLNTL